MRIAIIAAAVALAVGGCVRYTPHPWSQTFEFDEEHVEFVAPARLADIRCERQTDAMARLKSDAFVRLTAKEYDALARDPIELADDDIPYLVRGVTWSEPPDFSIVAVGREQKVLYVTRYTYNFEFFWPGLHWKMAPRPAIAVLQREIHGAMPRAMVGGDAIMFFYYRYKQYWEERGDRLPLREFSCEREAAGRPF